MNEYQDAEKWIDAVINDNFCTYISIDAIAQIKELIEKAKPKKPLIKHYTDSRNFHCTKICCPNDCHIQLIKPREGCVTESLYCPKCGQRIDWGDEEDE